MRIGPLLKSRLAMNALWIFLGQGGQLVLQAFYFVILARMLGSEGYGAFAGITALTAMLVPFAGFGSSHLIIKYVARDRTTFPRYWGNTLLVTAASGCVLFSAVLLASRFVFPTSVPLTFVVFVSLGDLLLLPLVDASGKAFQSFERLSWTAQVSLLLGLLKLLAAILVSVFSGALDTPVLTTWGAAFLLANVIAAIVSVAMVHFRLGQPQWYLMRTYKEAREGFFFASSQSAQNIYNDIDKAMLARLSTLEATGVYAAAYRLVNVAFAPIRALFWATYSRFFEFGKSGLAGTVAFALRLLPVSVGYALFASSLLYACAPLVPYLLGQEFQGAVVSIRWLAGLPVLRALYTLAADSLTGADYQGLRTGAQATVATVNISLNLLLIPTYSFLGAIWATLVSETLLCLVLWGLLLFLRSRRATPQSGANM
jgi:O-antigen/teichoic acid export membrane protein